MFAAGLSYSGIRNALAVHDAGLNTPQGYERATRLEPDDAANWYLLGRYWQYNLEDPDAQRAIRAYRKALSVNPHSADTWLDLGTAYESEGDIASARNSFLQAKHDYPLSPEVSWRYGNFLLRQGELDAAFAQIKHAVDVDPKRGAAAFALCMRVEPDVNTARGPRPTALSGCLRERDFRTDGSSIEPIKPSRCGPGSAALHPQLPVRESFPLLEALIQQTSDDRCPGGLGSGACICRRLAPP